VQQPVRADLADETESARGDLFRYLSGRLRRVIRRPMSFPTRGGFPPMRLSTCLSYLDGTPLVKSSLIFSPRSGRDRRRRLTVLRGARVQHFLG
jgi:hypothetical protein